MKIVVDTPEDYKKWLKEKATFSEELKTAATAASDEKNTKEKDTTVTVASDKMMVQVEKK